MIIARRLIEELLLDLLNFPKKMDIPKLLVDILIMVNMHVQCNGAPIGLAARLRQSSTFWIISSMVKGFAVEALGREPT